jgi:hypothetical protein
MVDDIDHSLKDWIGTIIPGVAVSFDAPGNAKTATKGISVYLLELLQSLPPSTLKRAPLQLTLRYLITTWSDSPEDAHKMLGRVALAALDHPGFVVESESLPMELWRAFGVSPVPSIVLRVPLRQERPEAKAKPVLSPMRVSMETVNSFFGVLLGRPGDFPLADAAIELPAIGLRTHSDSKGRFGFHSVPSKVPFTLRIRAKGKEFQLQIEEPHPAPENALTIPLDILEG